MMMAATNDAATAADEAVTSAATFIGSWCSNCSVLDERSGILSNSLDDVGRNCNGGRFSASRKDSLTLKH